MPGASVRISPQETAEKNVGQMVNIRRRVTQLNKNRLNEFLIVQTKIAQRKKLINDKKRQQ